MGTIVRKHFAHTKKDVYYYKRSYRVKVDPTAQGKGPGSGRSQVKTEEVYLGTAEDIVERTREGQKPHAARIRELGLVCAALELARELGIVEVVDRLVSKRNQGHSVGTYVLLAALSKICSGTSRSGIREWYAKTVLPEHLPVDEQLLKSQNFWDAFDKILPQRGMDERRARHLAGEMDEDAVVDDKVIWSIEKAIWDQVALHDHVPLDCVLYDNTNFFTYMAPETPSTLAHPGHNKAGRHEKRQVGYSMAATLEGGLPLFHLLYRGNRSEAKLFPDSLSRMVDQYTRLCRDATKLLLVMDKGSNSKENLALLGDDCNVLGALVPSQHDDLMRVPLGRYRRVGQRLTYRTRKTVYGLDAVVVVVFNEKSFRKKIRKLEDGIERLRSALRESFEKHQDEAIADIRSALERVHQASRHRRFVDWEVHGTRTKSLIATVNRKAKNAARRTFGKLVLFTDRRSLSTAKIVRIYCRDKSMVEDCFKELKSPDLIRFQPVHAWTDSKLKVYALACALAFLLLKLMAYRLKKAGFGMSLKAMAMELRGIQEVVLAHTVKRVVRTVTELSPLQTQMSKVLGLQKYYPT